MNATNVLQVSEEKHTVEQYKVFERRARLVTAGDHFAETFGGAGAVDYARTDRAIELDDHTLYYIESWGLQDLDIIRGDILIETVYTYPVNSRCTTWGFKTVFTKGAA